MSTLVQRLARLARDDGFRAFLRPRTAAPVQAIAEAWLHGKGIREHQVQQLYVWVFIEAWNAAAEGRRAHTQKESS